MYGNQGGKWSLSELDFKLVFFVLFFFALVTLSVAVAEKLGLYFVFCHTFPLLMGTFGNTE